jgi:hypothetical protein
MSSKVWMFAVGLILLFSFTSVVADEPAEQAPAKEEAAAAGDQPAGPEQISELIKQLNDDRFAARQDATRKLTQLGKDVVAPLAKAAQGDELEVTTRAFSIFEKLLNGNDAEASTAVRAALKELAESENEVASTRAGKLLAKAADAPKTPRQGIGRGIFGGPIQLGGNAQIQIQVQAINGQGVKKVRIKNVNGAKDITVEEGGKKVQIKETPNAGIKVEVTEKNKDGKEETKKYEAKNAAELKKKHPEAHKLYEKYSKNNGIQIQGIGGGIQVRPQRIQIGPNGRIQIVPQKKAEKKADDNEKESEVDEADEDADARAKEAEQKIKEAREQTEKLRRETLEKQIEQLQKAVDRLKEAQKNLDQPEKAPEKAEESE